MNIADGVILAAAVALVLFTVVYNIRKKKQNTCGCTSSNCRAGSCKGCRDKEC